MRQLSLYCIIPTRPKNIDSAGIQQGRTLLCSAVAFCRRAGGAPFVVGGASDDPSHYRIAVDVVNEIVQIPAVLHKNALETPAPQRPFMAVA